MQSTRRIALALALCLTIASFAYVLAPQLAGGDVRAPWAMERPSRVASAEDGAGADARAALVEIVDVLHVDLLEKLAGAIEPRQGDAIVALDGPEAKTLYFHAVGPVGTIDAAQEFAAVGPGPSMDETAPTSPVSKTTLTGPANSNFRKNFLTAYWGGAVHGIVTDVTVTLWAQTAGASSVEVTLFGDGPVGVATPAARLLQPVPAGPPVALTFTFPGVEMRVNTEMVVSVIATGGSATVATLYDSTAHPSAISFTLAPLTPPGPRLDDPAGIAFRAGKTLVANAGSGSIIELDGAAAPIVIASGYYPAGFTRGLGGIATDAAGNAYFAETDTGKVHFLTPGGATGLYADGLGAPTGLAFDAAGDLFVGDAGAKRILKVAPDRTVTTVTTLPRGPFDLAFAPNGTLTVSTFRGGFLYNVDVATGDAYPLASLGPGRTTEGLAYDVDGNLWLGVSTGNVTGALMQLASNLSLSIVNATLGGPIHLAFLPGEAAIAVATQGELSTLGDAVLTFATPAQGLALAAPSLTPTPIADWAGWIHHAGGRTIPSALYPGVLPTGLIRDVGRDPSEPTLGIQSDGDIFTVAASSAESRLRNPVVSGAGEPAVMRSQDDGLTWEIVSPTLVDINDPPATADPFLYVDPATDRVFTYDLTAACAYLSYSDDSGDTWTTNRAACGVPTVDHQSMVAAKPRTVTTTGYPNVLYHCTNWIALSPCGRSLDGGDTWSPAGPAYIGVRDQTTGCTTHGGLMGHLGADLDGRIFAGKSMCGNPYVSISEDDGLTWDVVLLNASAGIRGHDIDFAVDSGNNLYAMWIGADSQPYFVASTDHGASWGPARAVSPTPIRETQMPSIAAGDVGHVVFAFTGTTNDYGYAAQNAAKTAWNGYITVTTDALAADPLFATINPHEFQDPLVRGACARPCGGIWDFLDVRIGPDGRAWTTIVDSCKDACVADRSAPPAKFGTEVLGALATGPRLRGGGALDAL